MADTSVASTANETLRRPHAAPHRRHSLFGTEDRIVLDIGSRCTRVGFSGEAQPRKVFPTVDGAARPGIESSYSPNDTLGDDEQAEHEQGLLWDLDLMRTEHPEQRKELLKAKLTILLRRVYQDYLMTDPSQRKVILVENPMTPLVLRECIYSVLFDNLRVPSISPMSAPLLSALAVGTMTALVVSIGALETTILPIYQGRPLLSHFASTSRAGRTLEQRLRALLLRYARLVTRSESTSKVNAGRSEDERVRKLEKDELSRGLQEDILTRACFVADPIPIENPPTQKADAATPLGRGQRHRSRTANDAQQQLKSSDDVPDWQLPHTGDQDSIAKAKLALERYDEADDAQLLQHLKRRYEAHSTATPLLAAMPSSPDRNLPGPRDVSVFPISPATFVNSVRASSAHPPQADLIVPGWVRERVADFFWDDSDVNSDDASLPELILETISRLPIDLRKPLSSSILITGGPASLPGFAHRTRREVQAKLDLIPDAVAAQAPVLLNSVQPVTHRNRAFKHAPLKHLRGDIAVMNDHWPVLDTRTGKPVGSSAPCIPPLLQAWYGGSLVGSLRLSSVETIQREEWDALKIVASGKAAESSRRPGLVAARGRGSFMGVVGGLDTGAFGGLAAISRHMGLSSSR